ncbi:MAG: YdeI/OmpD-associated family protein [Pseudobacteriovorax sp.]|nr:YdeI/OmpD-associated family protein [Pseudobacteriovorax sp.]
MGSTEDSFFSKAKDWRKEMEVLRPIILKTKLEENIKWSKPCYSINGNNVVIIQPFKKNLSLMFFKGKLLKDPKKLLVDNGPNSQSAMRLEFESEKEIKKLSTTIRYYIKEAMALEESGQKVEFKKKPEPLPEELAAAFKKKPKLKSAFHRLTPGRQRAYILHIASAKQSASRTSRIEKCSLKILAGKGLNDR